MSLACLMGNEMGFDKAGTNKWAKLVWPPLLSRSCGEFPIYRDIIYYPLLWHHGLRQHNLPPVDKGRTSGNLQGKHLEFNEAGMGLTYPFRRSITQALLVLRQPREPVCQEACDLSASVPGRERHLCLSYDGASLKRVSCDELANDKLKYLIDSDLYVQSKKKRPITSPKPAP